MRSVPLIVSSASGVDAGWEQHGLNTMSTITRTTGTKTGKRSGAWTA